MKKKFSSIFLNLSVFNKMLISLVLTSLVSVSIVAYAVHEASAQMIINKALQTSLREMDLIVNNYESTIFHLEQYAETQGKNPLVQNLAKALYASRSQNPFHQDIHPYLIKKELSYFCQAMCDNPLVAGAGIRIEKTGDFLLYERAGFSFPNEDISYLASLADSTTCTWNGPYYIQDNETGINKNILLLLKPVIDDITGERLALWIFYVNENSISSILNSQKLKELETLLIVGQNQKIISSNKKLLLNQKVDPNLLSLIPKGESNYNFIQKDPHGDDNLVIIKTIPYNGWHMIYTIPVKAITQENRLLRSFFFIIYIASILISLLLAYLFSKTITKPIVNLLSVMSRVKRGEFDVRADTAMKDEVGMLSSIFNSIMDTMKTLMNNIYIEQQQKREYEFKLLQAQIKPHFLYNTIETVIVLIKLGMKEDAISVARCLCNFYRGSLSKGMDVITIEKEVDIVRNYLMIQKKRYEDYLDYIIDVSPSVLDYMIPKLTIQPLIENAIYHGLKLKEDKGLLKVSAYEKDSRIYFEIYDNGTGISQRKLNEILHSLKNYDHKNMKKPGFGIASIDWRIKLYFGPRYGIEIKSSDLAPNSYTLVTVTIPKYKGQEEIENVESLNPG